LPGLMKRRNSIKNKTALQAQAAGKQTGYTARSFSGGRGSATVEAALVLPFFLCALCTVMVIAQFILAETSICHASLQTARVLARQESCFGGKKDLSGKDSSLKKLGGILETRVIFSGYLDKKNADPAVVAGGRTGIVLKAETSGDRVKLRADYIFKAPVPFFRFFFLKHKVEVSCRKFVGFAEHDHDGGTGDSDTVFVTEYGEVYHTSLSCSHLTIHITDPARVRKIMKSSRYRGCEKCIRGGGMPSEIYLTKEGDCYHSTLSCSGLKRSVNVKKKSQVSGMRICSECGKKHGK